MANNTNNQNTKQFSRGATEDGYVTFSLNGQKVRAQAKAYEKFRRQLINDTYALSLKESMKTMDKESAAYKEMQNRLWRYQESLNQKALEMYLKMEEIKYERASASDKARISKRRADELKAEYEEAEAKYRIYSELSDKKKRTEKALKDQSIDLENKYKEAERQARIDSYNAQKADVDKLLKERKEGNRKERIDAVKAIQEKYKADKSELKKLKKIKEDDLTEEQRDRIKALEELTEKEERGVKNRALDNFQDPNNYKNSLTKAIVEGIGNAVNKTLDQIDSTIDEFFAAQGRINARLQGSGQTYQQMTKIVADTIGLSGYVSQKKVLENIQKLSDEGIAYNIEQRAFLATISENIASTFDAANGTLLRLIRIQQADSTQARLGMEAYLTKFLNNMYSDTGYLNDLYDNVSAAIIDANSQLSRDMSVEFEYAIQKWLGSLSSLGVSENAITNIATGINYLATGNVSALSSNQGLQTLLAMSANRAGISYGSMLTGGLQATETNDLLEEMVKYLQDIASQENQVVKSAYANMFGLSLADLRAISSLSKADIENISQSSMNYNLATKELESQMSQIQNRVHMSTVMKTVYENYVGTVASDIGTSTAKYMTWMIADLLENTVGGIPLPTVSVFGSSVDLNSSVAQMMKLGIVGYSTLSQLGTLIGSIGKGSNFDISKFGFSETTGRGTGLVSVARGAQRFESSSLSVGSGFEESDVQSLTRESQAKAKESVKSDEGGEDVSIKTIWDAFKKCLDSEGGDSLRVTVVNTEPIGVSLDYTFMDNNRPMPD